MLLVKGSGILSCNVLNGSRTPEEAEMSLKRTPYKPLSNMSFEANKQIDSGRHREWSKYVIGGNQLNSTY